MTKGPREPAHEPDPWTQVDDEQGIDFGKWIRVVWDARVQIVAATVGVLLLYLGALVVGFALSPVTQTASQAFELKIRDEYPNGARFVPEDIISIPVLEEVYANSEVARFADFGRFRNGFLLTKSSVQLEMLSSEYRARLAEARLTAGDRAEIEAQFRARREELLEEPIYVLSFSYRSRRFQLPRLLLNKILADVLAAWARQTEQRKGALGSEVVFFSSRSLRQSFFEADEPLVGADTLRVRGQRLLESLDTLGKIRGAAAARTSEPVVSLADVRARIEDALSLRVAPTFVNLQMSGAVNSPTNVRSYFESRLNEAVRAREESRGRLSSLEMAVRNYGGEERAAAADTTAQGQEPRPPQGSPEVGGDSVSEVASVTSFLDSLAQLATRKEDAAFRRDLSKKILEESMRLAAVQAQESHYQDVLSRLPGKPGLSRDVAATRTSELERALAELEGAVDDLQRLHLQLTTRNLTSPALLYVLSEPFVLREEDGLSETRPLMMIPILTVLCLVLFSLASLVHHRFAQRPAAR
jgi:hypothetical protein